MSSPQSRRGARLVVTTSIDGGDHTIYLGEIEQAETPHEGKPLLFFRGGYRAMGD